jgi:site-specific DNA recombinase
MPRKHQAALHLPPMPPLRDGIQLPAGVYTRRSDDDQSSFSPEAQEKIGRMYCQQNRLAVAALYFDDDYSGTNGERPDFERIQKDAAAGRIRFVVVPKIDRFARDVVLCLMTVDKFHAMGVRVCSVAEPFDFATPAGRLMLTNMASQAEYYSRNLSTEVKKGLYEKAERGGFIGLPPLGYRTEYQRDGRGDRIPKSGRMVQTADAATVLLIGQLYATGNHSEMTITEELNRRGLTTIDPKTGQRRPFQKDAVNGMLKNPVYVGMVRCGGQEYPGNHEPIWSRELWDQIQAIRARRSRLAKDGHLRGSVGSPPVRGEGGLLSELAFCGYCGARLHWHKSGNVGKGRQGYYRCSGRRRFGSAVCSARMIPAKQIEPLVLDVLRALTIPPRLGAAVIAEVQRRLAQPVTRNTADPRLVQEQLRRLRAAYLAGDEAIDDVTYARERARLEQLLEPSEPVAQRVLDLNRAVETLGNVPCLLAGASVEQQRGLIQQIFQTLWLEPIAVTAIQATPNYALLVDAVAEQHVGGTTSTGLEPATFSSGG